MKDNNLVEKTVYFIFRVLVGMMGYTLYKSVALAILCGIFPLLTLIIWLINHQLNLSLFDQTFSFLWR